MNTAEDIIKTKEYIELKNTIAELKVEVANKRKEAAFLIAEADVADKCINKLQDNLEKFLYRFRDKV